MSTRIDENGARTKKLWPKQGFRGLFVKDLKDKWPNLKKPRTKM